MLANGLSDLTPQDISLDLFGKTEGERRKAILAWINFNKKAQEQLKSCGAQFNKTGTSAGKDNAMQAVKEYKELDQDKKIMVEMCKDKWHPLPEVAEKEVIFTTAEAESQQ